VKGHLSRKHIGKYYKLIDPGPRPMILKVIDIACKGSVMLVVHHFVNKYKKCTRRSGNCIHFKEKYCSKRMRTHCMSSTVLRSYKKISKLEGVLHLGE